MPVGVITSPANLCGATGSPVVALIPDQYCMFGSVKAGKVKEVQTTTSGKIFTNGKGVTIN